MTGEYIKSPSSTPSHFTHQPYMPVIRSPGPNGPQLPLPQRWPAWAPLGPDRWAWRGLGAVQWHLLSFRHPLVRASSSSERSLDETIKQRHTIATTNHLLGYAACFVHFFEQFKSFLCFFLHINKGIKNDIPLD